MSLSRVNAMRVPFAEKAGTASLAAPDVIGVAETTAGLTMKMWPPRENAMFPFWPVNAAWAEPGAAARARRRPAARGRRRQRIMVAAIPFEGRRRGNCGGPDMCVRPLDRCFRLGLLAAGRAVQEEV